MATKTERDLAQKSCKPCEGGVEPIPQPEAETLLNGLTGWQLAAGGKSIRRQWRLEDFAAGIDFFQRVAELAEREDHHPDLHLTGYRNVAVELSTHAIGGLSENDFILAAKINELPVKEKAGK
jgi:4a-hydroxytetrahydrobiopterin dehydratase